MVRHRTPTDYVYILIIFSFNIIIPVIIEILSLPLDEKDGRIFLMAASRFVDVPEEEIKMENGSEYQTRHKFRNDT